MVRRFAIIDDDDSYSQEVFHRQSLLLSFGLLKIRTKDRRTIVFAPNEVQCFYLDVLCPGWRWSPVSLRGLREILLKARQFGFTTLILALMFLDTIANPNTQTVVIAHDARSTEKMFEIVKRYYKQLPGELQPKTKYANRREYLWPELDSYFFVGTAGAGQTGRGGTVNNVHGSEVAFWPNAEDIVLGLMESVPDDGNIVLETTANGFGNYYQTEYSKAEQGDSVFHPRFFGWWQHPLYQIGEIPKGFVRTEEENKLVLDYAVTNEQLMWRRRKIKSLGAKFAQEYPACPEEAFLTSGNPYFDREFLSDLSKALKLPEHEPLTDVVIPGTFPLLRTESAKSRISQNFTSDDDWAKNVFFVWKPPVAGRSYVIGADTAEGLTESGDHDYDSADVFDAETWEQVAQLHGRWDTHTYGLMLAELGFWYNTALLGVERNNHGHAVINAILYTAHYPEANEGNPAGIYMHQEFDETKNPGSRRAGWPTTHKSKTFILSELATSILEKDLKLHSRRTVAQLLSYVHKPGGKSGGDGKAHDDAVISCALGNAMLRLRPRTVKMEWT
ncbi:terminase [Capsulimonas corticalis]|uniref:Terminase n=1 Tax=Capsulimonas corticalis TaxID=2219043 RepID=A0A402CZG0_9BACT|nr:hypothetical protein [Capsulimonas corticalis]BDI29411.1 terminase [Capsulimonas corticalis]